MRREAPLSLNAVRRLALGVAAAVVVVDRLTKLWAEQALADRTIEVIDGWLRLRLVENPGAAFGLFANLGLLLVLVAAAAVGLIFHAFRSVERRDEALALGLVLGGALGNLIDRLVRGDGPFDGKVVDWIEVPPIPLFHVFNVADAAITVGAVLLLVGSMRRPSRSHDPSGHAQGGVADGPDTAAEPGLAAGSDTAAVAGFDMGDGHDGSPRVDEEDADGR